MPEEKKDEFEITDAEIAAAQEKEIPIEADILEAVSFKDLYDLLKQKGEVKGSRQSYKAEHLIPAIEQTRKAFQKLMDSVNIADLTKKTDLEQAFNEFIKKIGTITRKEDLRFKVLQLLFYKLKKAQGAA